MHAEVTVLTRYGCLISFATNSQHYGTWSLLHLVKSKLESFATNSQHHYDFSYTTWCFVLDGQLWLYLNKISVNSYTLQFFWLCRQTWVFLFIPSIHRKKCALKTSFLLSERGMKGLSSVLLEGTWDWYPMRLQFWIVTTFWPSANQGLTHTKREIMESKNASNKFNYVDNEVSRNRHCCQTLSFTTIWPSANTGMSNS